MKRILIDSSKCAGCKNCSIACMQARRPDGSVYDIDLTSPQHESRNTILINAQKQCKPLFCRHCSNPACVKSCMSGAMVKSPETGHVGYDPEKCAECFMCVMNCPFGVLKPDRATGTYVVKCDFCADHNSEPQCVKNCPTGAIRVEEVEQ
ncbi:MAG: nitrate reductase [Defluviitaleaceae bacterium]|nr:nitrate reductase [Defluviitaleaceae bacterium]